MKKPHFNNKTFKLLNNSTHGKVDSETLFYYNQEDDLITADYSGGSIIYGKIIARYIDDTLEMLYTCCTTEKELRAGKATALVSLTKAGKIKLDLNWKWLEKTEFGTSTYIEI